MVSLILIPSIARAPIVAFQGDYQREYLVNLNETNKITVTFKNVIYRENSTLQYKILPSTDNALYLEAEGHQNYSWGIYLIVRDDDKTILSSVMIDTRLSDPIITEYNKAYTIEIEITMPKNIPNGRYPIRFMALSKEYETENEANNYTSGISAGAMFTENIGTEQYIIVDRWPVPEPEPNHSFILIGIFSILVLISIITVVIKRKWAKKQSTS